MTQIPPSSSREPTPPPAAPGPLAATVRMLNDLAARGAERELVATVVQAAAIWHDLDARAYRRDLHDRFGLESWLAGADLSTGPREFAADSVVWGPEIVHIRSIAEQEQLGWVGLQGELVLVPVSGAGNGPEWVIAIADRLGRDIDSNFLLLCRMLGMFLGQLSRDAAQQLVDRMAGAISERLGEPLEARAAAVLEEAARTVGAQQGLVGVASRRESDRRLLATIGDPVADDQWQAVTVDRPIRQGDRLAIASTVAADTVAVLELRAPFGAGFSPAQARLARAAAAVLGVWLAGASGRAPTDSRQDPPAEPVARFEARIAEELARARRYDLEAGLLVIDLTAGSARREPQRLAALPLPVAVTRQLRASDVMGRLEDGRIGVVLTNTDAKGVAATVRRMRPQLAALARQHGLPPVALGQAVYPSNGTSVDELLSRAGRDAADPPP